MPQAAVLWLSTSTIAVAGGTMATVIAVGSTSGIATARASACALVAIGTIGTIGTTIVTKSGVLRDGPVNAIGPFAFQDVWGLARPCPFAGI